MPFDSVISIGGQSLLDGVWRILQPALQPLSNPLPISLPGMTNAWVRIRKLTPTLSSLPGLVPPRTPPGAPLPSPIPALALAVELEVLGNILLTASVKDGTINLALPVGDITFPQPKGLLGRFKLPNNTITITAPAVPGMSPTTVGTMSLPPDNGTLDLSALEGKLNFAGGGSLGSVALPLPSVVPLTLNLPPKNPARLEVGLPLYASPIDQASTFGLQLVLGNPTTVLITPFSVTDINTAIQSGLRRLLPQLGVTLDPALPEPFGGVGPTLAAINTMASSIATAAQNAINNVVTDALTGLTARTGRIIFPLPGAGSTCDTALLPTAAMAQVVLTAGTGGPILQVGFLRTGVSVAPFDFPPFTPSAAAEVEVKIDNDFLLSLLSCLVEKLPNFTFLSPATPTGFQLRSCRTWPIVTLELWPLTLNGMLELCMYGGAGLAKMIYLRGSFRQDVPHTVRFAVEFTLELKLQLNDVAALTGLQLASASVTPYVRIDPRVYLFLLFLAPSILSVIIENLLGGLVNTVLNRARSLTSPVAIPLGIFEAFGRLVPASLTIDDLTVNGTLATPTAPWALLPLTAPKLPQMQGELETGPLETNLRTTPGR